MSHAKQTPLRRLLTILMTLALALALVTAFTPTARAAGIRVILASPAATHLLSTIIIHWTF